MEVKIRAQACVLFLHWNNSKPNFLPNVRHVYTGTFLCYTWISKWPQDDKMMIHNSFEKVACQSQYTDGQYGSKFRFIIIEMHPRVSSEMCDRELILHVAIIIVLINIHAPALISSHVLNSFLLLLQLLDVHFAICDIIEIALVYKNVRQMTP